MPQLTIYVDRDLELRIRRLGVPVSKVCQQALRAEADRIDAATARRWARRKAPRPAIQPDHA